MALSDLDQSRFLLYAGRMLELDEVMAQADSPIELRRHIEEWERSRRDRGGDDDSISTSPGGRGPRPLTSGAAEADENDV